MLRRILVPVRGDGMSEVLFAHAAKLAQLHNGHIVVAHSRTAAEDLRPYGRTMTGFARQTMLDQATELADQEELALRQDLHRQAEALNLLETDTPDGTGATVSFVEEFGRMADVIKHNGRLADLVVVAKPNRDRNLGVNALKSALFETGRPVLMCPKDHGPVDGLGTRVAIAWNGSLEAARTVGLTLPIVEAAQQVTLLSGGKEQVHGATTEELVAYYALRGITANVHRFEMQKPHEALLAKTIEVGADMLIMGAYGQGHGREALFGGNTQAIVDKAEIPVLMGH
ncbi:MAG: universal stress protein [Pseudomonadota bacterium]